MQRNILQWPSQTWVCCTDLSERCIPSNAFGGCCYKMDVPVFMVQLGIIRESNLPQQTTGHLEKASQGRPVQQELRGRGAGLALGVSQGWGHSVTEASMHVGQSFRNFAHLLISSLVKLTGLY